MATAAAKTDNRQYFPAAEHKEPLLARIPSSHAVVFGSDSRGYRLVRDDIMLRLRVNTWTPSSRNKSRDLLPGFPNPPGEPSPTPASAANDALFRDAAACGVPLQKAPLWEDHFGVPMMSIWSTPLRE